ncbi:MAG: glycoside hydrolase family 3 N-terminal domain-containing protein [Eubacteriales bacterium]|nr:glycoside hydrolase family 3 N-terminal domain-containing protein [Eubacteriales bacterium]
MGNHRNGRNYEDEERMDSGRQERRRRRKRAQRIAYAILAVTVVVLGSAGFFAVRGLSSIMEQNAGEAQAAEAAEAASGETSEAPAVIETPEETSSIEIKSDEELLDEIAQASISTMSLEDKVAGLFFITPEALTGYDTVTEAGNATQEALKQYPVGGLIYFADNLVDREQVSAMLDTTVKSSKYPIFLGVDEEGGTVARIAGNENFGVTDVGAMADIGATGDASQAGAAGETIGTYLSELGFTVDFAPVADVLLDSSNTTIGTRSFGSDPAADAAMVGAFVTGLQQTGVSACVKHFPGLGDTTVDTHTGAAATERTVQDMAEGDFISFQGGIDAGTDLVMVSHVAAPNVNGDDTPSSLSYEMITNQLRGTLGYNGVVITDALNMGAITEQYTSAEAAVAALQAGADMLLMPENFQEAYEGVLAAVQDGTLTEERIDESLLRIYRVKKKSAIADMNADSEENSAENSSEAQSGAEQGDAGASANVAEDGAEATSGSTVE